MLLLHPRNAWRSYPSVQRSEKRHFFNWSKIQRTGHVVVMWTHGREGPINMCSFEENWGVHAKTTCTMYYEGFIILHRIFSAPKAGSKFSKSYLINYDVFWHGSNFESKEHIISGPPRAWVHLYTDFSAVWNFLKILECWKVVENFVKPPEARKSVRTCTHVRKMPIAMCSQDRTLEQPEKNTYFKSYEPVPLLEEVNLEGSLKIHIKF